MSPPVFDPAVVVEPALARRLEVWARRHVAARRRPDGDGPGSGGCAGSGYEFLGARAYRAGDELRQLDWDLLARLDRPYVRVMRRETGEHWRVIVDTSASMGIGGGVGRDGEAGTKLQRACEIAAALTFCGVLQAGSVELVLGGRQRPTRMTVRKRADLARALELLRACRAEGPQGIGELLGAVGGRSGPRPSRLFLLGDLFDLQPGQVVPLARRPSTDVAIARILAPHELSPPAAGIDLIEWIDPETRERLTTGLDRALRAGYERTVTRDLETWRVLCSRHGLTLRVATTHEPFEPIAADLLPV